MFSGQSYDGILGIQITSTCRAEWLVGEREVKHGLIVPQGSPLRVILKADHLPDAEMEQYHCSKRG